jgi:osmotically-inducible protein OsmY
MSQPSDSQIQTDVMNELRWEPRISHEEIGVAVRDGIVTLSGHVPSYAEKMAAEKAAMRVRGVRGIAEEIAVRIIGSHRKDDTDIANAVANALSWHVWTPDNIKAKVEGGWVTLTGQVDFEYQRLSARDSVRFLTGVTGVTNNITVKPTVNVKDVQRSIEDALRRDAELEADRIRVQADGNTIKLTGNVHSYFEKQAAGSAAWRAAGVSRVDNDLVVA